MSISIPNNYIRLDHIPCDKLSHLEKQETSAQYKVRQFDGIIEIDLIDEF